MEKYFKTEQKENTAKELYIREHKLLKLRCRTIFKKKTNKIWEYFSPVVYLVYDIMKEIVQAEKKRISRNPIARQQN